MSIQRKIKKICLLSFLFVLPFSKTSFAEKNKKSQLYIGVSLGTTGINANASYYYKNLIGLRGEYNFVPGTKSLDKIIQKQDNVIAAHTKFNLSGLDLSVRPTFGSWHVDIGFRSMNYSSRVNAYAVINNTEGKAFVSGDIGLKLGKGIKPYFGMGWNFNPISGLDINLDVGFIYTGKWKATIDNVQVNLDTLLPDEKDTIHREIEEAKREIYDVRDTFNKSIPSVLCFCPVIKIGIGWQFDFFV